jgi:hypothetical protein
MRAEQTTIAVGRTEVVSGIDEEDGSPGGAALTMRRPIPVCADKKTFSVSIGMSQRSQNPDLFLDGVTQHLREHRFEAGERCNDIQ